MKASLSCDDLFNLQDLQEFEPKSPYVPDLAPDDGRVSLRQELIMPQILAASPPKAPPQPAAKPATNADFTAYQLFVRDVLVRYPCGSNEFEEFQKMFRDYLRKKCTRFVALRRHDARARACIAFRFPSRARAPTLARSNSNASARSCSSRARRSSSGRRTRTCWRRSTASSRRASTTTRPRATRRGRPAPARPCVPPRRAAAGREPARDHARQGRAGGRRARPGHEPGHLGRRRARPAPRRFCAASERRRRRRRGPFLA